MRFDIDVELILALRAWREERAADHIERAQDAFCLYPGLGPASYLTADGRVLIDGTDWDGEPLREATDSEAFQTIVVGARKTRIERLLMLLPAKPPSAGLCQRCNGDRFAAALPGHEGSPWFVCPSCNGLGWSRD
jgi:hypothetical protein